MHQQKLRILLLRIQQLLHRYYCEIWKEAESVINPKQNKKIKIIILCHNYCINKISRFCFFRIQQLLHRIILWKHIFLRKSILLLCKKLYFKTFCFSFLKGKAFCFFVRNYISTHFASAFWKEKHFALASEIKFLLLLR